MGMNDIIRAMFQGYKEAKESNVDKQYRDLNWKMDCWIGETSTPLLEVADLNDLVNNATNDDQLNEVLEHLYRHDATRVSAYEKIERRIINKMWEE